jgi:hypothetical protein
MANRNNFAHDFVCTANAAKMRLKIDLFPNRRARKRKDHLIVPKWNSTCHQDDILPDQKFDSETKNRFFCLGASGPARTPKSALGRLEGSRKMDGCIVRSEFLRSIIFLHIGV